MGSQLLTVASSAEETLGEEQGTRTPVIEEPDKQTHTIPSYASWFSWNRTHEIECRFLKEFFDGRSSSNTPQIYKDYRDFMISKYRENPLKRMTFTEVRKMLVGDVNSIRKIFDFMETWGLINFLASSNSKLQTLSKEMTPIVVENIKPAGVSVISPPNLVRSVTSLSSTNTEIDTTAGGVCSASLASHKDVFAEEKLTETHTSPERKSVTNFFCNNCRADCTANHYDCEKAGFVLCPECFEDGEYGLGMSATDFKLVNLDQEVSKPGINSWTDQETLLLLEATLHCGDNWKYVAQCVGTKSEDDCVMKLVQLPFGEQFMGFVDAEGSDRRSSTFKSENKIIEHTFSHKDNNAQIYQDDDGGEDNHNAEDDISDRPLKRRHLTSLADVGNPIMAQVASLTTVVGPYVAAAAAQAAVAALCEEDTSARQIIGSEETKSTNQKFEFTGSGLELERSRKEFEPAECKNEYGGTEQAANYGDSRVGEKTTSPPTLQMRAAIATVLGVAAAQAKLLADREGREIEYLMSTIIESQLKKLHCKIQHFEELELIMEKEYTVMEQTKELLLADRMHFVQQTLNSGFSGGREKGLDNPQGAT